MKFQLQQTRHQPPVPLAGIDATCTRQSGPVLGPQLEGGLVLTQRLLRTPQLKLPDLPNRTKELRTLLHGERSRHRLEPLDEACPVDPPLRTERSAEGLVKPDQVLPTPVRDELSLAKREEVCPCRLREECSKRLFKLIQHRDLSADFNFTTRSNHFPDGRHLRAFLAPRREKSVPAAQITLPNLPSQHASNAPPTSSNPPPEQPPVPAPEAEARSESNPSPDPQRLLTSPADRA